VVGDVLAQRDDHHTRPELWHTEIRGIQKVPFGVVAHLLKAGLDLLAVVLKDRAKNTPDVFDHDGAGAGDIDQIEGDGKQVAFVTVAELLAGDGEGRAGKAPGEQVNPFEGFCVVFDEVAQILLKDLPFRPVEPEGVATMALDLDQAVMSKAGLFQAECLSAGSGAKLQ